MQNFDYRLRRSSSSPCSIPSGDPSIASPLSTSSRLSIGRLHSLPIFSNIQSLALYTTYLMGQAEKELVMDLLQSIVEIVTYGDRQDPFIFE
ncbi:hypothetical protein K1719_044291 [Acacia pycnantha]|nr:hypothetical protein K1719_044291 [Acacia pycnantha]